MMKRVWRGATAGMSATAAMTAFMSGARGMVPAAQPAPAEVTGNAERAAGLQPPSGRTFDANWLAAHFGYGTAAGVVYGLGRPWLPRSAASAGLLFGTGLWALDCLGVLPRLNLYPDPLHDEPRRAAIVLLAHVVYGATLAGVESGLSARDRPGEHAWAEMRLA